MPTTAGTVLHCDLDGTLREIRSDGLGISSVLEIARRLDHQVVAKDAVMARDFIAASKRDGAAFNWMFAIDLAEGPALFRFDGSVFDGGLLVIVGRPKAEAATSQKAIDAMSALNNGLVNRLREMARAAPPAGMGDQRSPPPFTAREHEVVVLLLDGLSNHLIARRLEVEESAVKARLRTIYRKLGVASRAQAVKALLG
ncbi:LuxR C-terminal-related transcriptional regulator [Magnetospirillum sp. UT-4]|uniref:helix-turn-helix transcriptional regulator n=1 Tax=Magnetospirillum sp. UT-4 TaxID=2681467 RepID=UPI001571627D|nr:LuxR C-terminal-related transcriptional regulator [Magnetospirillum sp. UT-4]